MMKRRMMSVIAMLLAMAMLVFCTGCSSEMMDMLMDYAVDDTEYIGEDDDIYSLSLFDDLPGDYSDIDPLFWVVEGEMGNKVYFLGSIHCADESAYRIPEYIMNAYLESDALAVECNTLAFENDLVSQYKLTSQYYMYTDGSTIEDHISPELYDKLVEMTEEYSSELSAYSYTLDVLNKCTPAVWQSLFDNIAVERAGLDTFLGIDYHFLNLATSQSKQIVELESVEEQMAMLCGFSDELNELLLWDYVETDMDDSADAIRELYEGWKVGDPSIVLGDGSEEITAADFDMEDYYGGNFTFDEVMELSEEYNNALLTERNKNMANLAEEMINDGMDVFYIVGLAHMVGEGGIVDILEGHGYTVTQLGGMGGEGYDALPEDNEDEEVEEDLPTSTAPQGDYEDMYDLYVDLYEYYGGTTARTTKTTQKTERTNANSDDDGVWGGWGYSDDN